MNETTGSVSAAVAIYPPEVEKQIVQRAQELYEARGKEDGRELDDWLRAEAEITGVSYSPELRKRIVQRAQELHVAWGGEEGHELDDWLRAEAEITGARYSPELERQIGQRARELYQAWGREGGHELDNWLRAEAEITGARYAPELEKRIGERARELYEARGREAGHELDDWILAEAEILGSPSAVSAEAAEELTPAETSPRRKLEEQVVQPGQEFYATLSGEGGQELAGSAAVEEEIVLTEVAVIADTSENSTAVVESRAPAPEKLTPPPQELHETRRDAEASLQADRPAVTPTAEEEVPASKVAAA